MAKQMERLKQKFIKGEFDNDEFDDVVIKKAEIINKVVVDESQPFGLRGLPAEYVKLLEAARVSKEEANKNPKETLNALRKFVSNRSEREVALLT